MAYTFYRSITLDHSQCGSTDTSNFTVMVHQTVTSWKTIGNGGHVQSGSGFDLIFSANNDGSSPYTWEMLSYNAATGEIIAFVLIPTLGHSADTVFYACYGNNAISTFQGGALGAAWNASYLQVYHLQEASNPYKDSTANALDSTTGTYPSQVTGLFGKAQSFVSASSQNIQCPNNGGTTNPSNPQSWSGWGKLPSSSTDYCIPVDSRGTNLQCGGIVFIDPSTSSDGGFYVNAFSGGILHGSTPLNDGNWHYLVGVTDTTSGRLYVDGVLAGTISAITPASTTVGNLVIGGIGQAGGGATTPFSGGLIQEVRITKSTPSADQILSEWNNIKSGSTLITVGTENSAGSPINESLTDTLTLSDAIIDVLSLNVVISGDAFSLTDALIFTLGVPGIAISDSFAFGDSQVYSENFFIPFFDTFTLADSDPFSPAMNMMAFKDLLTLSDSLSTLVIVSIGITDALTLSDTVRAVANILLVKSDTFTFSDLFGFDIPFFAQLADNFIWRDAQIVAWSSVLPTFADNLTLSDSVVVANLPFWTVLNESLSDSLVLSDSLLFNASINIPNGDTLGLSDNITVNNSFNPFNQSLSDSFLFSDGILLIVQGDLIQLADSLMLSDSVLIQNAINFDDYIRRYLNDAVV